MAVSPAKLSSSGTIDTGNKTGHITNHALNEKRKELKTTFSSRTVFHELGGGADAKVLGYVKRGTQDPTKGAEEKEGPPCQPWRCRFFFLFFFYTGKGYQRDGRQKLGGGVPSL